MGNRLENSFSEGERCVALFKVANKGKNVLPKPDVQMYLSWILGISDDANLQKTMSAHVVDSSEQLHDIIDSHSALSCPSNAIPYLTAKTSGAFHTSWNSLDPSGGNIELASECYSIAIFYATRMGKRDECSVFSSMALHLDEYTDLLRVYRNEAAGDSGITLTDRDFLDFKEHFEDSQKKIVVPAVKIDRSDKKILL